MRVWILFVLFQVEDLDSHSSWQCSASIRDLIYHTARAMVHTSQRIKSVKVKERRRREVIITTKPLNPRHSGIDKEGVSIHRVIERLGLTQGQTSACEALLRSGAREIVLMMIVFCWANSAKPAISKQWVSIAWKICSLLANVIKWSARQSFMSFCWQFWETFESNKLRTLVLSWLIQILSLVI